MSDIDPIIEAGEVIALAAGAETRAELAIGLTELELVPFFADSASELIAAASEPRRLAIVDLDRPGLDPGKVCQALRESAGCSGAPILLLANGQRAKGNRVGLGIDSGASDYLWKPFTFEELARKVRALVGDIEDESGGHDLRDDINWRIRQEETFDLDGYCIDRIVGRGGMGTIYGALQTETGEQVAIKVLSPSYSKNQLLLSRFLDEARTIREIHHPHVIRFHDVRKSGDSYYAVMECVEGGSLKEYLEQEGALDVDSALFITTCVASALAELYRHRIVHRDIKPGNILISEDGLVKLVDFGLAKSTRDRRQTRTGVVMGTPRYIAPEQAREGATADTRADIYSLGITLYQLLTGTAPFIGDDTHEVLVKHLSESATPVDERVAEIPPMVSRLVSLMIAKAPEDRFQTPNQLLEGIEFAREGKDPLAAIPSDQGPALARPAAVRRKAKTPKRS